jgi:hypothetical protein
LARKQTPALVTASSSPASDGPTSRAPFTIDEFRAMALPKSSRLDTISVRNAWRPVMSKVLTTPMNRLSRIRCQTWTTPASVSAASNSAWSIARLCVSRIRRCLFQRSVSTPATGERNRAGTWPQNSTRPRSHDEPVIRNTSQDMAICCIQVPTSEMPWPAKNSR